MQCEMCGKDTELFLTELEGAQLKICKACGRFGKVIKRIHEDSVKKQEKLSPQKIKTILQSQKEIMQVIAEDYAKRVKESREKTGLSQEDFAKKVNEKVSVIHHIETGKFEPPISLARKLEKMLHIQLVEEHEETKGQGGRAKGSSLTIGDVLVIKKK